MKQHGQGLKICFLVLLAAAGLFGCGAPAETPASEMPEAVEREGVALSFFDLFALDKGYTRTYEGDGGYKAVEIVANVENLFEENRRTLLYIEGFEENSIGILAADSSYLKKIRVDEDRVEWIRGETVSVLLKRPLETGNAWETPWYVEGLGFFKARVSIKSVHDQAVSVAVTPAAPEEDQVPADFFQEIYMEKGEGIASETYAYAREEGNMKFKKWIYKTSQIPPSDYVSRYVDPPASLRPFYLKDNYHYEALLDGQRKKLTGAVYGEDESILEDYGDFLLELGGADFRTIRVAALLAEAYMPLVQDPTPLMHAFRNYYESTIKANVVTDGFLDQPELQSIYEYDSQRNRQAIRDLSAIEPGITRIKASILAENGMGLGFTEGMPYFCPESLFMQRWFGQIESAKSRRYLEMAVWEQDNNPMASDGGMRIPWDALAEHLHDLSRYADAYPESPTGMWAEERAGELFEMYAVPDQFLPNTPKYLNGIVAPSLRESYEAFVSDHPESAYAEIIRDLLALLGKNNGMYSMELEDYLSGKGYDPDIGEFVESLMREQRLQLEDMQALYDDYGKISAQNPDSANMKTVMVSNMAEFLDALAPDTRVVLKAGSYVAPYEYDGPYAKTRYGETTLENVDNLVIEGEGEQVVNLLSEAYGYVFRLVGCENVTFKNIRMGHLQEFCKAGVLYFEDSGNLRILNAILFGSGEWGLETKNVRELVIDKTLIADCSSNALRFFDSREILVTGTNMARNGVNIVWMENVEEVTFSDVKSFQNDKSYYGRPDAVFEINGSIGILMENSFFNKKNNQEFFVGDSVQSVVVK